MEYRRAKVHPIVNRGILYGIAAISELTAQFLQSCDEAGESERHVIERLTKGLHISRNTAP